MTLTLDLNMTLCKFLRAIIKINKFIIYAYCFVLSCIGKVLYEMIISDEYTEKIDIRTLMPRIYRNLKPILLKYSKLI